MSRTRPAPYDASDEEQVRKARAAADLKEQADQTAIRLLMDRTEGRNWIWGKLSEGHIFETSFSDNAMNMAFREGERNYALRLMNEIEHAVPDLFAKMFVERGQG